MSHPMRRRATRDGLLDATYVELARSLFGELPQSVIMTALFIGIAALAIRSTHDPALAWLGAAGAFASAIHLLVVGRTRGDLERRVRDRVSARRSELAFAASSIAFATVLGTFAARAMLIDAPALHMAVATLVTGYAAGIAASVSLRPRVGAASIAAAVVPTALSAMTTGEAFHIALGTMMLGLMTGGIQGMRARLRTIWRRSTSDARSAAWPEPTHSPASATGSA